MQAEGLLIKEIFHSIQGETSLSGLPFAFIRLTGCDLRCSYCDSSYAFKGGKRMTLLEIEDTIEPYKAKNVLITGGEPLLQRNTPELVERLKKKNYKISIETHGEISIQSVVNSARIVLDIKTPSSGMCRGEYKKNLPLLKPTDEVKFVIASSEDYSWAKTLVLSNEIPTQEILFSAAMPALNSPSSFPGIQPKWLAEKILEDRLPVRFQLQLHKYLWGFDSQGV